MPNAGVNSNLDEGVKTIERLQKEIPVNVKDARQKLADGYIREGQRTLQRNGSVVTATGITSFSRKELGQNRTGVLSASYLDDVDVGTSPHWPDVSNYRFIAAARSYGMTRPELAATIALKGTKPHPWKNETRSKIDRKAKTMIGLGIENAIKASLKDF